MQIGAKHIENLLMTMILKKNGEKAKIPKNILFQSFLLDLKIN
jgi:hypothetical protein